MLSITPEYLPERSDILSVRKLGQGGFGEVYSISLPEGKKVVLKVSSEDNKEYAVNEIFISTSYRHPNLMRGLGVIPAGELVPRLASRGIGIILSQYDSDLAEYLNDPNNRQNITASILDIINGYRALRELGFIHGDIKPQNILVRASPFRAVLADFGTCRPIPLNDSRYDIPVATPFYAPPEIKYGNTFKPVVKYSEKFDVYSMGIMFGQLLRLIPAGGKYMKGGESRAFSQNPDNTFFQIASATLASMIAPESKRLTFQQVLSSPFYTYLIKLHPKRQYKKVVLNQKIPVEITDGISKLLAQAYSNLFQAAKTFVSRIGTYKDQNLNQILQSTSVEVIARAEVIIWKLLKTPKLLSHIDTIFWMAFKMIHTTTIPLNAVISKDPRRVALEEEAILVALSNNMVVDSLFDIAANRQQVLEYLSLETSRINDFNTLFTVDTLPKFPLNMGGKDLELSEI